MSEIIYGIHAVQALLKRAPQLFREVYILNKRDDQRFKLLIKQLEQANIMIQLVNRKWLDGQVEGAVHQGIIALVQQQEPQFQEQDLPALLVPHPHHAAPLLLVLDGITDSHNLGACLRCADAAGVHAVIIPRNRSAHLNATAKKVASGAAETIPLIRVTNLVRTLRLLQEYHVWIIGTALEAVHNLYQKKLNLTRPIALVMGAEGKGMRRLTKEHCDELISIPMAGSVSSLNVSVAVGICLFEAVRQRQKIACL
ncbi:23S rRNA (guanosine(2251)-2'-O)-methyltransferase RlmB [Candidatus Palibaumannia cicadellinicola]|uniref:23S rRNA (guanosine-2'-O-)-methyltransferase RlmB n=1 Tax=Candidatus Palibaumannia cicadellinicola TaxID=186490 RepID=A0A2N4XXR8_9GAMM|nr:23S rRNA (guanosine(2251)-2'-O)-methyltransferase RlmB [Candidatus Baumannia cicadellinicola]PLK59435.1 23S rRNA (guanosine(2251)-2'-O)-methyltransferase RlmB [Candidatus Baumannia cicadellinicola]